MLSDDLECFPCFKAALYVVVVESVENISRDSGSRYILQNSSQLAAVDIPDREGLSFSALVLEKEICGMARFQRAWTQCMLEHCT